MSVLAIPHWEFGELRLSNFLGDPDVVQLVDWEYLEHDWIGEAFGFTEWLRLRSDPNVLRSIALDLEALPAAASTAVLEALRLPLAQGLSAEEITAVFGRPSTSEVSFIADRTTYEFLIDSPETYAVGCTVQRDRGLIYLTVHTMPLA